LPTVRAADAAAGGSGYAEILGDGAARAAVFPSAGYGPDRGWLGVCGKAEARLLALALVMGLMGGMAASRILGVHPALATTATTIAYPPATITVPRGGLLFRTQDGKTIAALTVDDQGGHLTIMNGAERPVANLGAFAVGGDGALTLSNGSGQAPLQMRVNGPQANIFLSYGGRSAMSIQSYPWGGFLSMDLNPAQRQPSIAIVDSASRIQRWHAP